MEITIISGRSFQLTPKAREAIWQIIRLICLGLFAISAYAKIVDHDRFVSGMSRVEIIGQYAALIAWSVPVAETIVSLLLIYPYTHRWGLYGFTGLMIVFTLYIGSMLLWAERLPCYCNLIIEKLSFGQHLVFNLAFICLSIFALWLKKQKL